MTNANNRFVICISHAHAFIKIFETFEKFTSSSLSPENYRKAPAVAQLFVADQHTSNFGDYTLSKI